MRFQDLADHMVALKVYYTMKTGCIVLCCNATKSAQIVVVKTYDSIVYFDTILGRPQSYIRSTITIEAIGLHCIISKRVVKC